MIKFLMFVVILEKDIFDNLFLWMRDVIENVLVLFDKLFVFWLLECFSDILLVECLWDKCNVVYLFELCMYKFIKNVEVISEF